MSLLSTGRLKKNLSGYDCNTQHQMTTRKQDVINTTLESQEDEDMAMKEQRGRSTCLEGWCLLLWFHKVGLELFSSLDWLGNSKCQQLQTCSTDNGLFMWFALIFGAHSLGYEWFVHITTLFGEQSLLLCWVWLTISTLYCFSLFQLLYFASTSKQGLWDPLFAGHYRISIRALSSWRYCVILQTSIPMFLGMTFGSGCEISYR